MDLVFGIFSLGNVFLKDHGVFLSEAAANEYLENEHPDYLGEVYVDKINVNRKKK